MGRPVLHALPCLLTSIAGAAVGDAESLFVWHLTDVHVDPYYVENADARACYCETYASCPRMGAQCASGAAANKSTPARPWGNSEGNCATPPQLYESAVQFMAQTRPTPFVYFTGDFAEAGASYDCSPTSPARRQVLDIMHYDWRTLKASMPPATRVFGSLGNHDSAPGDVFYGMNDGGKGQQSWQLENLTALWSGDLGLGADPAARDTLRRGGYYAVRAAAGLVVLSLNVNYWVSQNPQAVLQNSTAAQEGTRMLAWFGRQLAAAEARGDAVHVLGHQPPTDDNGAAIWLPGRWASYTALCSRYARTLRGQFFGHIHVDQWTLTRTCRSNGSRGDPWRETRGIKWCSGGGDFATGDAFGAGVDGLCPRVPAGWSATRAVAACTALCNATNASACVGYTMYFEGASAGAPNASVPRECCFRTGSTASKPTAPTSTARCYEKPGLPGAGVCDGPAATALLPGPALTQGYPATNPSVRLLEFDPHTYELLDAHTYTADLHAANAGAGAGAGALKGGLKWVLEYSFRDAFGVGDLSAASLERLNARLASSAGDAAWDKYRGRGDGSLFVGEYTSETAPFPPANPPTVRRDLCTRPLVDFRSDTATVPTDAMRAAMLAAEVGDDALGEDPTCLELEAEAAALCGQEAGVFVPSGTFANILAMGVHLGPLSEVICDARCHIVRWENGGSVGGFTGASARTLDPEQGARFLGATQLARSVQRGHAAYHVPPTALLALENTLNGAVQPAAEAAACARAAHDAGARAHLDGARLWNACAALGCTPAELAAPFDTASVCLSKGLGAPVGSLLLGSRGAVEHARHLRKRHGGAWRQAGMLAAAGLHALRHHRHRVERDHDAAGVLAAGLQQLGFSLAQRVETNMVWVDASAAFGAGVGVVSGWDQGRER
eukprot:g4275.t1